jgi:hypothetical protein
MTTATYKKVGRYFKATHPEGFASWAADQRNDGARATMEFAGRYIEACDPEMFDNVAGF